jgi:hypothetical protein
MGFVNHFVEEEEKPLWYYASPQLEDSKVQKSDLILEAIKYKINPQMIEMVAANPFRGVKTDNPYRHIERFTMLCNTVQQEGVPIDWYKWNPFPYSLADKAKQWHSLASFEVEGNWNRLVKKFCEKIFPISRVQKCEEASDIFYARRRRMNRSSLGKIQWIGQTRTKARILW